MTKESEDAVLTVEDTMLDSAHCAGLSNHATLPGVYSNMYYYGLQIFVLAAFFGED